MSRETFLARVRDAARSGCAYRVHVDKFADDTGYVGAGEDLCQMMADEVNAVGGIAHVAENCDAACKRLEDIIHQNNARSALCWRHPVLQNLGLKQLLESLDVAVHGYETLATLDQGEQRQTILSADIGITSADYAIAETGTLMVCSQPGQERVSSLLPPVHVAIVQQDQIVPDLIDAFSGISAHGFDSMPSNVSLITGPSKTGDIELQLTTGVHGPGKWYVIIVRSEISK